MALPQETITKTINYVLASFVRFYSPIHLVTNVLFEIIVFVVFYASKLAAFVLY